MGRERRPGRSPGDRGRPAVSRFVLSRLEYDLCWDHLRLGEQPTALAIPGHGATMDERRELFHHAWRALV
ncbi:MAG: ESX secretion-associated protein EspG, partial [Umezawaea sp.]